MEQLVEPDIIIDLSLALYISSVRVLMDTDSWFEYTTANCKRRGMVLFKDFEGGIVTDSTPSWPLWSIIVVYLVHLAKFAYVCNLEVDLVSVYTRKYIFAK